MMTFNEDVNNMVECLRKGGVVLYPTDTVWGLGCDAHNEAAVEKIFNLKKRAVNKSMIVLSAANIDLQLYCDAAPLPATVISQFTFRPLTIIYKSAKNLAPALIAEDGSIAIRIVRHRFCEAVLAKFGRPIVSTSANISGNITPANFNDINEQVIQHVDYVVEHGREVIENNLPSAIIRIEADGEVEVLRK